MKIVSTKASEPSASDAARFARGAAGSTLTPSVTIVIRDHRPLHPSLLVCESSSPEPPSASRGILLSRWYRPRAAPQRAAPQRSLWHAIQPPQPRPILIAERIMASSPVAVRPRTAAVAPRAA